MEWAAGKKTVETLQVSGGRNEYLNLSFQIRGANAASFRGNFLAKGESAIEAQLYQVLTAPLSAHGLFQADALVPLSQGLKNTGNALEVWVTLRIPATCPRGIHACEINFSDDRGSYVQPIALRVWNFALPEDLPITIEGNPFFKPAWFARHGADSPEKFDILVRDYLRSMRSYKFNALGWILPFPAHQLRPPRKVEDFPAYDRMVHHVLEDLNYRFFRVPVLPGAGGREGPGRGFVEEAKTFYPLWLEYLQRHRWENRAVIKIIDEPEPAAYDAVRNAYALVKSLAPGIRTASAGREPDPKLAGAIDIWVSYAKYYNPAQIAEATRQGQEVWLYINKLHGIDQPLVNLRLIGWYLYEYRFPGILFWGLAKWPQDPWTANPGREDSLRRGTFYYPDPTTGKPVPTTRLEALRRGFQDCQYLLLVEEAIGQKRLAPSEFAGIRQKAGMLTRNIEALDPQVSMADLEALRNQMGDMLDRLGVQQGEGSKATTNVVVSTRLISATLPDGTGAMQGKTRELHN
ncbi:DUF4091 domain-containing protein [Syntrophobacter fumaroxidans]|uniref:DUF4091 domain-containing protein n=1 Tax=Syntrophobacter fumaroxidans TaxID=119484 RepID=UPI001427D8AC|nr:DUF4091 domain-containing protein [Syntrophobacter fumaroxidans]